MRSTERATCATEGQVAFPLGSFRGVYLPRQPVLPYYRVHSLMLTNALRQQVAILRRNPWVLALVLATFVEVLWVGAGEGRLVKSLAYLGVVATGLLITDLFTQWRPNAPVMPVRKPAREAAFIVGFCILGYLVMFGRFAWLDWAKLPGPVKLACLPLFGFVFPMFSAVLLLIWKYRPRDLGFRWCASAWVFFPVLALVAGTAILVVPQDLTWKRAFQEAGGVPSLLFTGFISAALSEEFLRLTLLSRLGALWGNGIAWFIAAVLWAFLHMPKVVGDGTPIGTSALGCLYIVPIGLLWGYMTHRTRSIWPAIICHGLNLWGLQNI